VKIAPSDGEFLWVARTLTNESQRMPAGLETQKVTAHFHHGPLDVDIPFSQVSVGRTKVSTASDMGS